MAGMNVSLTDELTRFVHEKVDSGLYHSASEVIRDGLRLLQEREELKKLRLARLREAVAVGLSQIESGEVEELDLDAFEAEGMALLEGRTR
jgi:antitoxin ParD1/3/4